MIVQYLGTAAAEGIPAIFCDCPVCRKARALGGRHIRSRSQAIVDGQLLIDFPADTLWHLTRYRIELSQIHHCLITHIHQDHFYPDEWSNIREPYAHLPEEYQGLQVYGSEDILTEDVLRMAQKSGGRLTPVQLNPFETVAVGEYSVTPLKALHGTPHPYFYLIEKGGTALLYAHDTDLFPDETWDYLRTCNTRLQAVSLDCTEGAYDDLNYHGHMCLGRNIACRERLLEMGLADDHTQFILNHFSHNGKDVDYRTFRRIAERNGFLLSYDGMKITF